MTYDAARSPFGCRPETFAAAGGKGWPSLPLSACQRCQRPLAAKGTPYDEIASEFGQDPMTLLAPCQLGKRRRDEKGLSAPAGRGLVACANKPEGSFDVIGTRSDVTSGGIITHPARGARQNPSCRVFLGAECVVSKVDALPGSPHGTLAHGSRSYRHGYLRKLEEPTSKVRYDFGSRRSGPWREEPNSPRAPLVPSRAPRRRCAPSRLHPWRRSPLRPSSRTRG